MDPILMTVAENNAATFYLQGIMKDIMQAKRRRPQLMVQIQLLPPSTNRFPKFHDFQLST
jgi:hypothetical protein